MRRVRPEGAKFKNLGWQTELEEAGSEMFVSTLERETAAALQRAIIKAVHLINANKTQYLHHLIVDVPPELGTLSSTDFRLSRLRYVEPRPYPVDAFERTYAWMQSWRLVPEGATYESLVDNRVGV
jgi:NitT/TauT family transport system substrate-binding protein